MNSASNKSFTYHDIFTILVVDDSSFVFKAISSLPLRYKTKLEFAKNGSEALMKYSHNVEQGILYHLVLMDLQMPIMDGFETARHIREEEQKKQYPHTFISAMSAFEESGNICCSFLLIFFDNFLCLLNDFVDAGNRAKREGMNNFCQKPMRLEILNNLIKQRCEEIGIPLPEQVNQ